MNIRDQLEAELAAASDDVENGRDAAVKAATTYLRRRLQQLARDFPRHRFSFGHEPGKHPTGLELAILKRVEVAQWGGACRRPAAQSRFACPAYPGGQCRQAARIPMSVGSGDPA